MKNKKVLQSVFQSVSLFLVFSFGYMYLEPAVVDAAGTSPQSTNVEVTQNVGAEISITASSAAITMSGNINGMTGGTTTGSVSMTVITNNTLGFDMKVRADYAPAMTLGGANNTTVDNFADYSPTSAGVPDYNWGIAATDSEFGFTVEASTGDDVQLFKSATNACNAATGTRTADKCWYNFATTDLTVVTRGTPTPQAGVTETLKFQAQSGSSHQQQQGAYKALITVTAATK